MADLPGVGIALAKRALEMRSQAGGFMSVQDFCQRMGLMPHFAVQIEGRAFATANPSNGSPSKGAARVVDI
ncbi:MAG: helix-hairpin-helix domain-containing protein [Eggerthellaceae bacterium]|nr:helix-hairpin-helix domain-containing protein [Eggerthellaceae bacterium]